MIALKWLARTRVLAALFAIPTVLAPHRITAAAGVATWGGTYIRPAWTGYLPGYPFAYPLYAYPDVCPSSSPSACAGMWFYDRRQWRRPTAPDQTFPTQHDIWDTTGSPWGYIRRLPPPTPESHIQPLYRDASTIRPEFVERGDTAPP